MNYTSPGVIGLESQTGLSYEIGSEWKHKQSQYKVIAYRLDLEDEIAYDTTAPTPVGGPFPGANINLDATHRTGIIFEGSLQATKALSLSAQYTYTDTEINGGQYDGNKIPFIADHVIKLSANYDITPDWTLFGEAQYTGERYPEGNFTNTLEKEPAVTVVNMNLAYKGSFYTISARVNNLTNEIYNSSAVEFFGTPYFFPAPERSFILTTSFDF